MLSKISLLALLAFAAPAVGQAPAPTAPPNGPTDPAKELPYDRGYDKPSARADAVNAAEAPVTARLNNNVDAAVQEREAGTEARYAADRQAYMDALVAHDAAVDRTDARWVRQQTAYADAMAAWRGQVIACKKGHKRACEAPTPNVADFY